MAIDYKKLGFKAGLEIHQQLDTRKLFSRCPSIVDNNPDKTICRRLRAVAGETGEADIAAQHEEKKGKYFIYHYSNKSTSLVELDEEPPQPISQEALEIAMQVSMMLKADILDKIQVMRKTVVDGSNTSGFQRTALIAVDGSLETSKGVVRIETICLEEDAARKIKEDSKSIHYNLDRLGIPLLEIATAADIKDSEHAKEVASLLGMTLRSTEKVKRGIGTIRQDVNVSIKGGARVEIKGFQDLKSMPKIIDKEIARQQKAIKAGKKIKKEVRKAEPDFSTSFLRPMPGAARMYPETDVASIPITKRRLARIKIPEQITERTGKLAKKYGLNQELASEIIGRKIDLGKYIAKYKIDPAFIARVFVEMPKEIKSRLRLDVSKLKEKDFDEVLKYYRNSQITKDAIFEILVEKAKGKRVDLSRFKGASDKELTDEIKALIKNKPGLNQGAYMGIIMNKHRGKVDGKKVMQLLNQFLSEK